LDIVNLDTLNPAMVLLIAAFAAPALVALAGAVRPSWVPGVAIFTTAIALLVAVWAFWQPDATVLEQWAPTWDLYFHLRLDGLARMYALLATGIGIFVVVYSSRYIPLHLQHGNRAQTEQTRFFGFLLLFMASMVGLVMAQDLIMLFLFWDLTAVASYYLIGFDRMEEESRSSAQMAILVTGISAVFVLIAAVILNHEYDTFSLPDIIAAGELTGQASLAVFLIMIGALAKSAQVPMHFWLPRAMAAPTPVSAYLHSAAMVAAGVFLIGRIYPLVRMDDLLLNVLMVIGYGSMLVGGIIALTRNILKQILAYSTISQYGYVVFMFGLGSDSGIAAATFYGSGLAASGLIALPFTIGFFKDELFFAAESDRGALYATLAVIGAALTFAYIVRFWAQTFLGPLRSMPRPISGVLVWPVVILGAITVVGGLWTDPFVKIAEPAASVSALSDIHIKIAYHLDTRIENLMAVATWTLGSVIYLTRRVWWPVALGVAHLGERFGPAHLYYVGLANLNRFSDRIHSIEVRDLRSRVATILLPAGVLVGIAVIVTPNSNSFEIGPMGWDDLPVITMMVASVVSALVVAVVRDHFRLAIGLSSVGYSLAAVYAFMGAPNVTVVALVVETLLSMFIIGMLVLMPRPILRFETQVRADKRAIPRDAIVAGVATLAAFFVIWGALSRPAPTTEIINQYEVLTPAVHGRNIVTVILADFRGFDTMGEITVIALTLLGIMSLLRSGRLR
jgi:multicomponent Na+:H+ antiporter subunit A